MGGVDVSVVIPVRNGSPFISKQLDALLSQKSEASFEVIVADNGSTDDTAEIVQRYVQLDPRVRLADAGRAPGANVARNVGVSVAAGGVVLLTDADDVAYPGWVDSYWAAFKQGAKSAGGGLKRVLADGTVLGQEARLYRARVGNVLYANATNCGFTVEAFNRVGGFDESLIGTADEVDFFWRLHDAGYGMTLVKDAVVEKLLHTDQVAVFTQHFNFGRGEAMLAAKFRPRRLPIVVFGAVGLSAVWGGAWMLRFGRRTTTAELAFSLGMVVEGVRLLSRTDQ